MEELGAASELVLGTDLVSELSFGKDVANEVKGRTWRGIGRAPLTVNGMPFLLFSMTILPMGIMYDPVLGYTALVTAILLSLGFVILSRHLPWKILAASCLMSSVLGPWMGLYDRAKYLDIYYTYDRSPTYSNIMATTSPGAFSNAAFMSFTTGTYVDITRGLGHEAGQRYCVAPVVSDAAMTAVGYWAVGTGCCEQRGLFSCGSNLTNPNARDGIVVLPGSGQDVVEFRKAVQQAATTYGIPLPQNNANPMLLFWNRDFNEFIHDIYMNAVTFCFVSIIALLIIVPIYSVTLSLLGFYLFDVPPSDTWHPDQAALMTIGFNVVEREYPPSIQTDLLNYRCYYSGEVIYDYAFYMANRHFFLSCFLAHPENPYSKRERMAVALIIMPLVVFPVAAFSVVFGGTGVARTLFMLAIVTVPRSLLQMYLRSYATADAKLVLEGGMLQTSEEASRAVCWELGVLSMALAVTVGVAVCCCISIHSRTTFTILEVIQSNLDALGYIFVLDILFDIIWPKELKGRFLLGFFHRWRVERDASTASKKSREEYSIF